MSSVQLINNLLKPNAYNHTVSSFKLLETHSSWVILTGHYAYKIKKPVDFVFLDFSTLEKRKMCCEKELALNKPFTTEIYLEIVTINGNVETPVINGPGPIIEYAIKMQEFPQSSLLSNLLADNLLTKNIIEQLAQLVAKFHQKTPIAEAKSEFGTPKHVHAPVQQNFEQTFPLLKEPADIQKLTYLQQWAAQQFNHHYAIFEQRKMQGFIRDCHGDLHLGNIILYQQKPLLFDRIEFNEDLRWNDVMADLGFLTMDLKDHKQLPYANILLNQYMQYTGDYSGLHILPYYQSYRAMVRAKVTLFRVAQTESATENALIWQKYRALIELAGSYTQKQHPVLMITYGLSGSGKSTIAKKLVEQLGAIHLSSDIERKRLFNVPLDAQNNAALYAGIYTAEATEKTYQHLKELTRLILTAGYSVIVDATFIRSSHRELFIDLAKVLNVPFAIIDCAAPRDQLEARIINRQAAMLDPSEARTDILLAQESSQQALSENETKYSIAVDTSNLDMNNFLQKLKEKISNF